MLFYGTYGWEVVCKATRKCSCKMANVGISFYIFRETLSKWACKFLLRILRYNIQMQNKNHEYVAIQK